MAGKLEFREALAMGVGGVVGGGIFAVLGVAAKMAGNAAFITYFLAGLIALASSYSFVKLVDKLEEDGGSFTFLEHYVSNKNIAGMVGWVLIVGYIGTMAMYSYAFGSFAANLLGIAADSIIRGLLSIGIVALFVMVNFTGVEKSGSSEDLLVYGKVVILLLFGILGLGTAITRPDFELFTGGMFNEGFISPIIALGAIFVSFEGWQLLTYEYSDIDGGINTLKKAVFGTIAVSTLIYVLVALTTTSLVTPGMILQHKETVLAFAAGKIFASSLLARISAVLISLAALFSTASAINATLFGTARLSYKIASDNELPDTFSFKNRNGIPSHSLLIIGFLTAVFTFIGTLEEITTFASVSFITIFGIVNAVALNDHELDIKDYIPAFGLAGTFSALLLLIWHLYTAKIHMLYFVAGLFALILVLEFFYFERDVIEKEAQRVEKDVEDVERKVEQDVEKLEEEIDSDFED